MAELPESKGADSRGADSRMPSLRESWSPITMSDADASNTGPGPVGTLSPGTGGRLPEVLGISKEEL